MNRQWEVKDKDEPVVGGWWRTWVEHSLGTSPGTGKTSGNGPSEET